jgi:hypothetical protein
LHCNADRWGRRASQTTKIRAIAAARNLHAAARMRTRTAACDAVMIIGALGALGCAWELGSEIGTRTIADLLRQASVFVAAALVAAVLRHRAPPAGVWFMIGVGRAFLLAATFGLFGHSRISAIGMLAVAADIAQTVVLGVAPFLQTRAAQTSEA